MHHVTLAFSFGERSCFPAHHLLPQESRTKLDVGRRRSRHSHFRFKDLFLFIFHQYFSFSFFTSTELVRVPQESKGEMDGVPPGRCRGEGSSSK